jgi:glycosyltransferase involved in cell wall biosynthesis
MKPRILMIIALFYPCLGGAEQQALLLAGRLIRRGYQVTVLTRRLRGQPHRELIGEVPVHRSIRVLPLRKLFGITYLLSALWYLYRNAQAYDVIHCHELHGLHCVAALLFKKLYAKKAIALATSSGQGSDFRRLSRSLHGRFFLKKLRSLDRLITLSTLSSQEALQAGFSQDLLLSIPNGVDADIFCPGPAPDHVRPRIICVGRLIPSKGVPLLVRALRQLVDTGIDAQLDLVGDGPERQGLQHLAAELGLSGRITFHGSVYGVAALLQRASVFVLPSFIEGMSNAVIEAMACGLPVITTRVGASPDLIDDGVSGLLMEAGDEHALLAALRKVLEDRNCARRLGAAARQVVEARLSIDKITDRYSDLYANLMESRV